MSYLKGCIYIQYQSKAWTHFPMCPMFWLVLYTEYTVYSIHMSTHSSSNRLSSEGYRVGGPQVLISSSNTNTHQTFTISRCSLDKSICLREFISDLKEHKTKVSLSCVMKWPASPLCHDPPSRTEASLSSFLRSWRTNSYEHQCLTWCPLTNNHSVCWACWSDVGWVMYSDGRSCWFLLLLLPMWLCRMTDRGTGVTHWQTMTQREQVGHTYCTVCLFSPCLGLNLSHYTETQLPSGRHNTILIHI